MARKKASETARERTAKQQAFIAYFLGVSQWNATDAARRAGYAHPNTEGNRLLLNAGVQQLISQRLDEISMSGREVVVRLTDQARATMDDFVTIQPVPITRTITRPVADLLAELRKKIQFEESYADRVGLEGEERTRHDGEIAHMRRRETRYEMLLEWDADATEDVVQTRMEDRPDIDLAKAQKEGKLHLVKSFNADTGRIELYDAQAAQVHLGKVHGLFREVRDVRNVDLTKLSDEQVDRLAAGEDLLAVLGTAAS
jgi:phage terminase small subunit